MKWVTRERWTAPPTLADGSSIRATCLGTTPVGTVVTVSREVPSGSLRLSMVFFGSLR